VGRRNEYRPKGGDALRLGVKADMVLFAGNTCDPYLSSLETFARRRAIQIHVHFTYLLYLECRWDICPQAPAEGVPNGAAVNFCDTKYTEILSSVEAGIGVERQIMYVNNAHFRCHQ